MSLSIGTKIAILEKVAKGASRKEIADKYGLKKSTLATLIANKKNIIEAQQRALRPRKKMAANVGVPEHRKACVPVDP